MPVAWMAFFRSPVPTGFANYTQIRPIWQIPTVTVLIPKSAFDNLPKTPPRIIGGHLI
jgi:hypothetical protein